MSNTMRGQGKALNTGGTKCTVVNYGGNPPTPTITGLRKHTRRLVLEAKMRAIQRALASQANPVTAYAFAWAKGMTE